MRMARSQPRRRAIVAGIGAAALGLVAWRFGTQSPTAAIPRVVHTFGDSILDCGRYNEFNVTPGQLIIRNDDRLFPEFRGRDLRTHAPVRLEHHARDGATVLSLAVQTQGIHAEEGAIALMTIGENDLLSGLIADSGAGINTFAQMLEDIVRALPIRPVLLGNVYDPTFGDDSRNFLGVDAALGRRNFQELNTVLAEIAGRYGHLIDLRAHFLTGDASWYTHTIEPSLRGASEVRRVFLQTILHAHAGSSTI